MDKFIGFEAPEFKELTRQIKEALHDIDAVRKKHRPSLADKRYLTGEEIMEYLHISPRTLQNLRDQRVICFTTIGGKILYPENELEEVLHQNYRSPELPF
ncbi:thermostable 8-oxoguanine DNA glycosylase [Parabacteroides sp. PFB2-10]|uniref:helix-turn-helix domain-containing protein n=1 Tax=Parabacteroides sp. PFB2-10 TaxID=1742405 RepID=UPI002475845B|nr:helix-turn-helix domain-containing protein [Parabacteroides sp. PFB2-10]MDH6313009.1 thermostable 8-oxoguanine DNA glycosylase [Parabacteroides sp. PFB2-10]